MKLLIALIGVILSTSASTKTCPNSCICSTTIDGLHKAVCSSIEELYKYTLNQKHHNINILDLSHNNITRVKHQLDRLSELVSLDLSTNGLSELDKFLSNGKKIVHLNLGHNRIRELRSSVLPNRISSLDLSHNLLKGVPVEIVNLNHLEHLILEGNPIECSCSNIMERDRLLKNGVVIDDVHCTYPEQYKNHSWRKLKTKDVCKNSYKLDYDDYEMMLGDDPNAGLQDIHGSDLDHGEVFKASESTVNNDDDAAFLKASHRSLSTDSVKFEGSGESVTQNDEVSKDESVTREPIIYDGEGSGEGSGFDPIVSNEEDFFQKNDTELFGTDEPEHTTEALTIYTGSIAGISVNPRENEIDHESPKVFEGNVPWRDPIDEPKTEIPNTASAEDTVSEKIQAKTSDDGAVQAEQKPAIHKTGTYVCIFIIIALLVGLIAFAVVKGQMRKRRDKRLLRQQQKDVEKAAKEMVDMNRSLLGKPAPQDSTKKLNGNYELVPTHDAPLKKNQTDEVQRSSASEIKNSPGRSNQDHSPTVLDDNPATDRDETRSVSSEELFVPTENDNPNTSGMTNTESDLNSAIHEYVPVYSPDMGRVRIKMTETPKPKTPVLVTRSRSNAGDIVITPAINGSAKSAT